jgi:xanthosine utilization system XapX-like protein
MSSTQGPAAPPGNQDGAPRAGAPANDADAPASLQAGASGPFITATPLFVRSVSDAEKLLSYAAQTGRFPKEPAGTKETLKEWVIDGVLNAQVAMEKNALTKGTASAFWASFADLSRITKPVTAGSLEACKGSPINKLRWFVVVLAVTLILTSIFLFINNSIAAQVSQLIADQNRNALRLWSHVQYFKNNEGAPDGGGAAPAPASREEGRGAVTTNRAFAAVAQPSAATVARVTPDELFAEVVEFSRQSHWLRETAWRLNGYFNPPGLAIATLHIDFGERHPDRLMDINVSPHISKTSEIYNEALRQIIMYQHIRNFSQAVQKTNSILYSGVTTYLLPAVYALLGATLFGLRHYAKLIEQKAYSSSSANSARYFIALIAGVVVGLFGSLLPESPSLPPLAIAFLVGYAVEAFFSRLDGFIAKVSGSGATQSQPDAPGEPPPARTPERVRVHAVQAT